MQALGLACKVRRRKRYNSYQGEQGAVAPNVLNREFEAEAPNQKWVTDVTEFSVGDRKLYLSPVMDLFDRQIISYSLGLSPNLALTNDSLREALTCLQPGQQPLVHSDQGFQYRHASWRTLIEGAGAVQSMSRKGNCYDNASSKLFAPSPMVGERRRFRIGSGMLPHLWSIPTRSSLTSCRHRRLASSDCAGKASCGRRAEV